MRFKELLKNVVLNDVLTELVISYPGEEEDLEEYEEVFNKLLVLSCNKEAKECMINISETTEMWDDEEEVFISVNGKLPGDDENYCIAFEKWENWLNMTVPDDLCDYTAAEFVAHCLWEMTWHGFSQEDIQETLQELLATVEEIEKNPENLIDMDEVQGRIDKLKEELEGK